MAKIKLTAREKQIVQKVAEGLTSQQIADCYHLSIHTVQTHRKNIMRRFNLKRATQMAYLVYNYKATSAAKRTVHSGEPVIYKNNGEPNAVPFYVREMAQAHSYSSINSLKKTNK